MKTAAPNVHKGIWLNLSLVAVMALTPVLNKFSITSLTPLQAAFLNAFFSTIMTLIAIGVKKEQIPNLWRNKLVLLLGLTNAIGIILQYVSVSLLDPVSVELFGRFYIVFALILSVILLHEKIQKADLVPIIFTLLGTALITNWHGNLHSVLGMVAAISYTFFFALTNLLAKKNIEHVSTNVLLLYNQGISALILGGGVVVTRQFHFDLVGGILPIFGSAFFSGFFGLVLFYEGLKYISFRDANLIRSLNPVFVFIFSIFFFTVPITPSFIAGAVLIVASIVWLGLMKKA
ncbi:peptide ABC transporter ATP-binding protein [Ligilactobacillus pabuli]|uniref:Peptide ABC transporter ATP-binding protein n=1 Tax=Ligilactobacillus pabuli TaxID=2886039 RepID=A0ABQ5JNN8_9LACO|nr:DMT family transporter [Ligilactobacillus pabuli]GKS82230.1 peptide ABC transporter ATP-binding protein [Ligilactobacillus pabuli]